VKKALYYFILFNSLLLSEILPQQITVTSPNGGENWQAGIDTAITWTSDNISGRVSIDLIGGGNLVTNGTFDTDTDWNKDEGITIAGGKLVFTSTISANDAYQTVGEAIIGNVYQYSFDIENYSAGGIRLDCGTAVTSTFSANGTHTGTITWVGNTRLRVRAIGITTLKIDNVSIKKVTPIDPSTGNDGRKPWEIPFDLEEGTDYKVKIASVDDPTIFDLSDNNFTITANTITVTSPNGGESWHSPPNHFIT